MSILRPSKPLSKAVITISGPPGSGKTSCAADLAKLLGLNFLSSGSVFRELAKQRGLTLEEFSKVAEQDSSIDKEIDSMTQRKAREGGIVIEGRLAAWFAKDYADLKVYLTAPLNERARRVAQRDGISFREALQAITARELNERRRYREYYGIDVDDLSIYDVVLNTSLWDKDSVVKILKLMVLEIFKT